MAIFKQASVTPIVKTVISQGLEKFEQLMPDTSSNNYTMFDMKKAYEAGALAATEVFAEGGRISDITPFNDWAKTLQGKK